MNWKWLRFQIEARVRGIVFLRMDVELPFFDA